MLLPESDQGTANRGCAKFFLAIEITKRVSLLQPSFALAGLASPIDMRRLILISASVSSHQLPQPACWQR
jgi:hypothetical protein